MKRILISLFILCIMTVPVKANENSYIPTDEEQINEIKNRINTRAKTFAKDKVITYKTYKISNIDKSGKKEDELNIYTTLFGKSTNTDPKGFEAVVINNRVVKLNNYNSYIPENGYVVSGHGKAKQFLTENLFEGSDVTIDFKTNEFKVITHPDNYLYEAIYRHDKMQALLESIERAKMDTLIVTKGEDTIDTNNMSFFVNRSGEILERAKKLIEFNDFETAKKMAQDSMLYSNKALYYSLAYDPDETKGIFVFPYQKTTEEVEEAFRLISNLNIDTIFIEAYYNGETVYPSEVNKKYGLQEQNHYYKDFDVINEWVKLAKENNKKIFISLNTFNIGNPPKSTLKNNIIKKKRKWLDKSLKKDGYFLNADNEEVQNYLLELITEVSSKYEISGINLKGLVIENKKESIDLFVNKVINLVETQANIELSLNVHPEKTDITNWDLNENIILLPILTSSDNDFAGDFISRTIINAKSAKIYPIYLAPYLEEKPYRLFDQITTARKLNVKGIVLYNIDYIDKEYADALKCSVFREKTEKEFNIYQAIDKEENTETPAKEAETTENKTNEEGNKEVNYGTTIEN